MCFLAGIAVLYHGTQENHFLYGDLNRGGNPEEQTIDWLFNHADEWEKDTTVFACSQQCFADRKTELGVKPKAKAKAAAAATTGAAKSCSACGKTGATFVCSACKGATYCDRYVQLNALYFCSLFLT